MHRTVAGLVAVLAATVLTAADAPSNWTLVAGGGFVSGPVEHVTTIPNEAGGGSDAVRHGDLLMVTSFRAFSIYDVSEPLAPALLSTTHLGPSLYNERPQTDGEILLISNDSGINDTRQGRLDIFDISDPTAPELTGRWLSQRRDHIWTCVFDCAYAYSAGGTILDLSDPTDPQQVGTLDHLFFRDIHVIEEVDDGLVVVGSNPTYVLDARRDPTFPTVLAEIEAPLTEPNSPLMARSIPARVAWPKGEVVDPDLLERDRLTVMSMETPFTGRCDDQSGWVLSFDTSAWRESGTWQHLDTFQITQNGTYADGAPPYSAFGCGSYGMHLRPGWGDAEGRRVAVTWFEHGMRLLEVGPDGAIVEVGGWLPVGGNAVTPVWISEDVLYVIDVNRGMDVLQVAAD